MTTTLSQLDDPTDQAIPIWQKAQALGLYNNLGWGPPKSVPLVTEPTKGPLFRVVEKRFEQIVEAMSASAVAQDSSFGVYDYLRVLRELMKSGLLPAHTTVEEDLEPYGGEMITWSLHVNSFVHGGFIKGMIQPGDSHRAGLGTKRYHMSKTVMIVRFPDESHRTAWEICR